MNGPGKPFQRGHVSTHDLSAAGRKGRKASSWQVRFNDNAIKTIRDKRLQTIREVMGARHEIH
jgi:hypothetical protein